MGLFSKKPRLNPQITIDGLEVTFDLENEWWEFTYRDTDFSSFEPVLTLPTRQDLNIILAMLDSLTPEMRSRLQKGWEDEADSMLDTGESYSVDVEHFARSRTFTVSWSGGERWGDMGVDFTIKDGAIIDESWGD
jgi:hypothetical protein